MASMIRYADSFEFDGRSDEYLRETFDLWATGDTNKDWAELYYYGCLAIIEECHTRALLMNKVRNGSFIDTPYRYKRRLMSFLAGIDAGFAVIWQRNLRQHHHLGNNKGDRAYIETIELGDRVRNSFVSN